MNISTLQFPVIQTFAHIYNISKTYGHKKTVKNAINPEFYVGLKNVIMFIIWKTKIMSLSIDPLINQLDKSLRIFWES